MKFSIHDVGVPAWGPFSRRYMGISHIADPKRGIRFDLGVFPGLFRRRLEVPSVLWECSHHPWDASPDLGYYSHRHEIVWKDEVYCDVAFAEWGANARLIRCEFVNKSKDPCSVALHHAASLSLPPLRRDSFEVLEMLEVDYPEGGIWVDAIDYRVIELCRRCHTDNLMPGGLRRGEIRESGFVGGGALRFAENAGDRVVYAFDLAVPLRDTQFALRMRGTKPGGRLRLTGIPGREVSLDVRHGVQLFEWNLGDLAPGSHELVLTTEASSQVDLDGFVVAPAGPVVFRQPGIETVPVHLPGPHAKSLVLEYPGLGVRYGMAWLGAPWEIRPVLHDELDGFLRRHVHTHSVVPGHPVQLAGNQRGHFVDLVVHPIPLPPGGTRVLHAMICAGDPASVENALAGFPAELDLEAVVAKARQKAISLPTTPAGEKFRFSQERMAAVVLTNIVYPIYNRRAWTRHYTPGRWWDCLYTWDAGFTGLGLLELDPERALDCLMAYLTPPGDEQAFVHFGSVVPVQIYLALEIWNRKLSRDFLETVYPRLRQYYRFLAGKWGSSTTLVRGLDLLKTWDYFYNSGGWDDYPPQVQVHQTATSDTVVPVITTAQVIRCAKILSLMAQALGEECDLPAYEEDIARFSRALQLHAWDEESGYFGYVRHDGNGQSLGILRSPEGANFNMGLDGAYPLVAGICSDEQEETLCKKLFSTHHLWTDCGLTTVDQSAPYYSPHGYWNGSVWMPHQWFFWKTLLDLGRAEEAFRVAETALEIWSREVNASYHCFEHFLVESGRGAGWHQFSGLSTPVLIWFSAYFRPGHLTTGFDVWVERCQFFDDSGALEARLIRTGRKTPTALVCLRPGPHYSVRINGEEAEFRERLCGLLEIQLPHLGANMLSISTISHTIYTK